MNEKFECLQKSQEVTLGDGHALEATGQGRVFLEMTLPDGKTNRCVLHSVLYVPKLSYNLLSVTKVSEHGKVIRFDDAGCQILNKYAELGVMRYKSNALRNILLLK